MSIRKLPFLFIIVVVLTVFCAPAVRAQTTTATILGIVKDGSGAVLPGVSIEVKQVETGKTRTAVSDDSGRYHVPNLELGSYQVQAELTGFQTALRSGIKLSVGQEAVIDFTMQVGQISEKVVVSGEAPLVETRTSTTMGLVNDKQIRDLPLNGRDFSQLATLQEGVYAPPTMGQALTATQGAGPRISISGARPNQNGFRLDGSDVQDAQQRTPAGVSGATLGVEAVREFTVLTNTYSAEYGARSGGVINAVTKSGTNAIHGSIFAFLRNDNLDARQFFDVKKPEFKRNQFGFTVGGPIRKDRTFFFATYEGLRDRQGFTSIQNTLSIPARQGILGARTIPIDPRVRPYVNLYPLPNGRDFGDGRAELILSKNIPSDEDYYLFRVDHTLSDTDTVFVRQVLDDSSIVTQQPFPGFQDIGSTARRFTTIEERKIVSPQLLNEFRFSFNRSVVGSVSDQTISLDPALSFVQGLPFGDLGISGLARYGYFYQSNRVLTNNMFEYIDNVSYSRGSQSIRIGAEIKRIQFNTTSAFAKHGRYTFTNVENFLRNVPNVLEVMLPGSDPHRGFRLLYFGAFIQDDIKLKPNFTLNLGLRYELSTEPVEVNGKVSSLVHPDTDKDMTVLDTLYDNPCRLCFAPRVGFAWDLFGDGKTALRGGGGMFYNILMPVDFIFAGTNPPPFMKRTSIDNPVFPSVTQTLTSLTNPVFFVQTLSTDVSQPYLYKYNLNIQRSFGPDLLLTVGYAGSKGVHMGREQMNNIRQFQVLPDGRKFFPLGAPRRNQAFGTVSLTRFDTNTLYNALQVSARKRFSQGYQFQVSYTFGKTMDASSGNTGSSEVPGATTGSADPFDWKRDWARAGFHVQNVLTSSFTYDVPLKLSGVLNGLLGGWQINGIVTVADGTPANFGTATDRCQCGISAPSGGQERPDLKPGGNSNPIVDSRNPDRYWDSSQFQLQAAGFFGNIGRATGTGPGVATFDFSMVKNFPFNEIRQVQFRSEFFNILNRANFSNPSTGVFNNFTGTPSATFGRITSTTTTARQIQFALKFLF